MSSSTFASALYPPSHHSIAWLSILSHCLTCPPTSDRLFLQIHRLGSPTHLLVSHLWIARLICLIWMMDSSLSNQGNGSVMPIFPYKQIDPTLLLFGHRIIAFDLQFRIMPLNHIPNLSNANPLMQTEKIRYKQMEFLHLF